MEKQIQFYTQKIQGESKEIFDAFRALLLEYNEKYNLTTILEEQDMLYKHFVDSAVGAFLFKQNASVAEIGSGAGFPSIPLKILRPDLTMSLFESVGKKCEFLRVVVDKLGLSNMQEEDGILDFFERYNFTINEEEPLEKEIAVDPEMLGKIFENLFYCMELEKY